MFASVSELPTLPRHVHEDDGDFFGRIKEDLSHGLASIFKNSS